MKIKVTFKHRDITISIEGTDPVKIQKAYKDTCWEIGLPVQGGHPAQREKPFGIGSAN